MNFYRTIFCVMAGLIFSGPATALDYAVGSQLGLMQQPTSNYYLMVYGAYGEVSTANRRFFIRGSYFERPRFESSGFSEQEFGGFGLIGTKVSTPKKPYGLTAMIGGGQMSGYIAQRKQEANDALPMRRYTLQGISFATEFFYKWAWLDVALFHMNFTGFVDQDEADAKVAWPFNFYGLRVGAVL